MTKDKRLSLQNLVLPAVTLGIRPLAIITQLTRSAMLDVLDQDYIRTAYAKGLSKRPDLETWLTQCIESGDHCHYRLVC